MVEPDIDGGHVKNEPTIQSVEITLHGETFRIRKGDPHPWVITRHGELLGGAADMDAAVRELTRLVALERKRKSEWTCDTEPAER
jgi:hypothetical protein